MLFGLHFLFVQLFGSQINRCTFATVELKVKII